MRLLGERINHKYYWQFYGAGVIDSPSTFLFGHKERPDRAQYPSAFNYYLDLVYNFGVIALLPIIYLIFKTFRNGIQLSKEKIFPPEFIMLVVIVIYYVIVVNSLKVSFRQPYPGMVMFFLWGVLKSTMTEAKFVSKS